MLLDVTVDEARVLGKIQADVTRRYSGSPKDLRVWSQLSDELKTRCNEAGFEVDIHLQGVGDNWMPVVDIVGRTDKSLERTVAKEGTDIERRVYEASRASSEELRDEGVDTSLLM